MTDSGIQVRVLPPETLPVSRGPIEFVERKGLGHPDTLCDAFAEQLAVALAHRYRAETGGLLHFNVDKMLLSAGEVERGFGGGRIVRPATLYVGDRVATRYRGRDLGVVELVHATAASFFAHALPHLDLAAGLRIEPVFGAGSGELADVIRAQASRSNDTSAAVGFAPATPLERATLELERWLNGAEFKQRFASTGQDVKIMAVRHAHAVDFTVAMPFLAAAIGDAASYREARAAVTAAAIARARELLGDGFSVSLVLNALDDPDQGSRGVYLTLSGTSAEHGDSGEVGRGNRANGLITLCDRRAWKRSRARTRSPTSARSTACSHSRWRKRRCGCFRHRPHRSLAGLADRCTDRPAAVRRGGALADAGHGRDGLAEQVAGIIEARLSRLPQLCDELSVAPGRRSEAGAAITAAPATLDRARRAVEDRARHAAERQALARRRAAPGCAHEHAVRAPVESMLHQQPPRVGLGDQAGHGEAGGPERRARRSLCALCPRSLGRR
ncbi:MAG: methionine adenosyltransferase [Planctomycetota bacterium]